MEAKDSAYLYKAENWKELKDSSGRPYYYNKVGNVTQWEKPECLGGGASASEGSWIEYKTEDGRTYYFNSVTKACLWNLPEEAKPTTSKPLTDETGPSEEKRNELGGKPPETSSGGGLNLGLGLGLPPRKRLPAIKVEEEKDEDAIAKLARVKQNNMTTGIKISLVISFDTQLNLLTGFFFG
jgi:WW domain